MSVDIRRVSNSRELRKYIAFPIDLYRGNPYYVPALFLDDLNTLDAKKNAAFEFCEAEYWLAYKEGKLVGRVAGIVNPRYIEKWKNRWARFGWLDFVEDFEVASALIRTVEEWARAKGLDAVHGPMGFTDLDREGLLVEGFDEAATLATNYNYPYYAEYLERLGYKKDKDWIEFQVTVPSIIPEKVLRVNELIQKRTGARIFEWKTKKEIVTRFGKELFGLIDEAYVGLYGTTPLSERQVDAYIKQYLGFVDPRFTKIIVDAEDQLIGFGISIPSLSDALRNSRGRLFPFGWLRLLLALRNPRFMDMYLVAVRPEYQARGVVAVLMTALNRSAIENGVQFAETNPELEDNIEVQGLWKDYDKRQHKRRRVFLKKL